MLNVGFMDGLVAEDLNRIQKLINHKIQSTSNEIFRIEYEKESSVIQHWFTELYSRLVNEKKIDVPHLSQASGCGCGHSKPPDSDWATIDLNSLRNKDIREIGCEWLCYQALEQLGVSNFLSSQVDWLPDDVRLALTHIVSRAVYSVAYF